MKVLLYLPQKDVRELLSFQITSHTPLQVKEMETEDAALAALRKDEAHRQAFEILQKASADDSANQVIDNPDLIDCAIIPGDSAGSAFLGHLKTRAHPIGVIFVYENTEPQVDTMVGVTHLGSVPHKTLVESTLTILQNLSLEGGAEEETKFCPIRTTLLIRACPLSSDIYIRLSKNKYVRLFHAGTDFDKNDLQKYYDTKKVEYMYLKRDEMAEFVSKFKDELKSLLTRTDIPGDKLLKSAEVAQEAIHQMIHQVGFTKEIQDMARTNVEVTLKAIGKNPKLSDILSGLEEKGNYISQHSAALAHVACCIAKEMEWGSESTFTKLVIASYMHDVSLTDPDLAKVNTLGELKEKQGQFPQDQTKSYHLHPNKAAEMVRSFEEIPADVDSIVAQHHERPGGAGFPRGLTNNYIPPLSTLFIIAHDLVQDMMEKKDKFSMNDFIQAKKAEFSQGNFRKVMHALEKIAAAS